MNEVVIPMFCCTSVVAPILAVGARPVLSDVGDDLNITAETVAAVLRDRTPAVIVPHLFGNPVEIDSIREMACTRNIRVIDDAAQALARPSMARPWVLSATWRDKHASTQTGANFLIAEAENSSVEKFSTAVARLSWHREC